MTDETKEAARPRYGWLSVLIAVVFGLIYADVLWNAVGDLIKVPSQFGSLTPWWLLILDVVLPVLAFVAAFLLGRRRPTWTRALLFLIGFCVIACSTVASIGFTQWLTTGL